MHLNDSSLRKGILWSIRQYATLQNNERAKLFATATAVGRGFSYNSGNNTHYLSIEEIRSEISKHVDPNFHMA